MHTLVVGASIIDIFLTQQNGDHVVISKDKVSFTLGDKVPIDIKKLALGGNGANVSVGLSRLGIPTSFYTYIGSDSLSQEVANTIIQEGVDLIPEKGEGYSSLSLIFDFDTDRIIFSHHPIAVHDFHFRGDVPECIYLTSIGDPWEDAFKKVLKFSTENRIHLAFSPGSRQMAEINDTFFETLHNSSSVFINKEEAQEILEKFGSPQQSIDKIMFGLQKLGPRTVSVTAGKDGAYALNKKGEILHIKPLDTGDVLEKTGAGDAYASGFLAALLDGKSLSDCMKQGSFNSYSVMKEVGATQGLLSKDAAIQLAASNPDYSPTNLS